MNRNKVLSWLFLIIAIGIILRFVNLSFPSFTADEARIAYRGYTISHLGRDELGRFFPLLFNSLTDYQLPAVSYITALGEAIFGQTEFGARFPFILIGIGLMLLTYKIARLINQKDKFGLISILVLAFSPALIFLSKLPNDSIVLAFVTLLLIYLLLRKRLNKILVLLVLVLSILVSKFAWFIIPPVVVFTLFSYRSELSKKVRIQLSIFSLLLVVIALGIYLQVPQSKRSLLENNYSILTSEKIKNGINKSRGEGLSSGWPNKLEAALFNKTFFPIIGFIHWLSSLQPAVYFGQFDGSGQLNFSRLGAFSKVLIIPFFSGLIYLARQGKKTERLLLGFFVLLTFPAIFIYPNLSRELVVLTLPFMAFIIAFGFMQFKRFFSILIISLMVLEVILSLSNLSAERKNTSALRPNWIKVIAQDVYSQSQNHKTAVSDDIAQDLAAFTQWYNPIDARPLGIDVPYPYKFRLSNLENLKIIGADNSLHSCEVPDYEKVYVSRRDKEKIEDSSIRVVKTYYDNLNREVIFHLEKGLCIK